MKTEAKNDDYSWGGAEFLSPLKKFGDDLQEELGSMASEIDNSDKNREVFIISAEPPPPPPPPQAQIGGDVWATKIQQMSLGIREAVLELVPQLKEDLSATSAMSSSTPGTRGRRKAREQTRDPSTWTPSEQGWDSPKRLT